jgi:EAL domain-containing protein (putative c-di-GMP-specific phosphodiesterase class I)
MQDDEIRSALSQSRLHLVLQPVVGALTFRPAFYEALLRWRLPDGTVRPAQEFIERAEGANMVQDVDRHALQLAIAELERWPAFDLALNISSITTSDFAWLAELGNLTAHRPGLLRRLIVEITETAAITDIDRTLTFVDALKDLGCRVAIDDFGAGYTNFTNLNLLAPDIVKIDRSYTAKVWSDPNQATFVGAVVDLSQTLSFETVAEGVETEDAAQALTKLGVTYLQGFLFGAPHLPQDALAR